MVEYIDETHTYLIDGVIVPSVTQLLQFKFPKKYKGIPQNVLENKAEYGTKIHKLIEILNSSDDMDSVCKTIDTCADYITANTIKQYLKLLSIHEICVMSQEKIVANDKVAGRYDMLAQVNYELSLCDIKTTATLDKEYLSWQLSIYNYLGKCNAKRLYAIWLPKRNLGQLVEVEFKTDEEIESLIEEWCKCNAQEN